MDISLWVYRESEQEKGYYFDPIVALLLCGLQVFQRIECGSQLEEFDQRFQYFVEKVGCALVLFQCMLSSPFAFFNFCRSSLSFQLH